jgi:mono/diheme cytochrome c family protein
MRLKMKLLMIFLVLVGFMGESYARAYTDENEAVKKGWQHFKMFCANCHGKHADGKGPLVEAMKLMLSDLTTLKQTGDICIAERVLRAVSGVHDVPEGQEQKMPVFSGNLESITIYEIIQFLKAIQK